MGHYPIKISLIEHDLLKPIGFHLPCVYPLVMLLEQLDDLRDDGVLLVCVLLYCPGRLHEVEVVVLDSLQVYDIGPF